MFAGMFAGWNAFTESMNGPERPVLPPLLGCYPHVKWHMTHGLLLRTDHPMWEVMNDVIDKMHLAQTVKMWDRLVMALARKLGNADEVRGLTSVAAGAGSSEGPAVRYMPCDCHVSCAGSECLLGFTLRWKICELVHWFPHGHTADTALAAGET